MGEVPANRAGHGLGFTSKACKARSAMPATGDKTSKSEHE